MVRKNITKGIVSALIAIYLIAPIIVSAQACTPAQLATGKFKTNIGAQSGLQTCVSTETLGGAVKSKAVEVIANGVDQIGGFLFKDIGEFLMGITSIILIFSGWLLDSVLSFTVTNMSEHIGTGSELGTSIVEAWATVRDVANMVFIFVLLYTAFRTMFLSEYANVGKSILNIIIIAILINFSLFFTKVVIDASNIVSDGFYRALSEGNEVTLQDRTATNNVFSGTGRYKGISGGVMRMLGMQNIYGVGILSQPGQAPSASKILLYGTLTGIFMLVAAIVLFMASIMFVARFIILIFLMILSPFAFIAYIIPGSSGKFGEWWQSLLNQAFFAPVFFALMWIAFKIGSSIIAKPLTDYGKDWSLLILEPEKAFGAIINYVLVLGLFITALTFSKQMASKGATAGAFGAITGAGGAVALGGSAWLGRTVVGQAGNKFANNAWLQAQANKPRSGILGSIAGGAARATLYANKQAASGTFDLRNAKVPTSIIGAAVEGTLGRTKYGKALGLNDINIPDVEVGQRLVGKDFGTAATKGYKESKAESDKRVQEQEAARTAEWKLAEAKQAVLKGANALAGSPLIGEMEKALAKLSDKETEALVASNRELLKSLNFANAISVKQLEAINKSDQFSESNKNDLKSMRFSTINAAMAPGGAGASTVRTNIRNLTDTELEMINPEHLEDKDFVGQLKTPQFESINKSGKFTTNQKEKLRAARRRPLGDAITSRSISDIEKAMKALGPKEVASIEIAVLKIPPMLEAYSPSFLKRMAPEMNPSDILELRDAIEAAGRSPGASTKIRDLNAWLLKPDGAIFS